MSDTFEMEELRTHCQQLHDRMQVEMKALNKLHEYRLSLPAIDVRKPIPDATRRAYANEQAALVTLQATASELNKARTRLERLEAQQQVQDSSFVLPGGIVKLSEERRKRYEY